MYQQGNPYNNDGATKISRGAGPTQNGMNMNGGGYGNGAAMGSGYGAGSFGPGGFGAGGYGGVGGYGDGNMYGGGSAYGAMPGVGVGQNNMYGNASLYDGGGGMGSMMGDMNENIIVTKLFSSRRDLDRVASAADFSRRFDSNWGSYRSSGADGFGNGAADAGSLMNLGESRSLGSVVERGIGAAGMGPDGDAAIASSAKEEDHSTRNGAATKAPREAPAKKPEAAPAKQPAKSPATVEKAPQSAPAKKPVEAKQTSASAPPAAVTKPAGAIPQTTSSAMPTKDPPIRAVKEEKSAPLAQPPVKSMAAREVVPNNAKQREAPPLDDIPLLADDVLPKKKATTAADVKKSPTPREVSTPQPQNARTAADPVKAPARPMRPRSRPASRAQSRMTSMSVIEFPEAEEMKDEMLADGLADPEKEAALAAAREAQMQQREEAARQARQERAKQRQLEEEQQKLRNEEARRVRTAKAEEERRKRELVAKMDEEKRKETAAALAARERQREEEKALFEEKRRAEEEKEAARAAAAIAERQRQLEKEPTPEKPSRPVSRPRSRRPASRLGSGLRGAIPEQPPDVEGDQIKDTLADDSLGKPMSTSARNSAANDNGVAGPNHTSRRLGDLQQQQQSPQQIQQRLETPGERTSRRPSPASPQSGGSSNVPVSGRDGGSTPQQQQQEQQQQPTPTTQKQRNMVKTFVLVEAVRRSNRAVQHTPESITYHGQTINVTELKVREEDNFNYNSTVVHDVREATCRGYNAAVLSMDTANTAGRFESPVWSILNRVVRTLLKENSNEAGVLRENFELACALGYLYRDKVKDLFAQEGESQFTKVAVNPSPIYGPRLTNLKYEAVTDPLRFEEQLSTTLSQSSQDPIVTSLTEGVVAAFVLVKQSRETDGKPDIYLSSLIVASSGDDPTPYQSAISHTRDEYATVFHLVLGGPSCTCFMLNVADDDTVRKSGDASQQPIPESIDTALALLSQMASLQNYDLRSGSVKRFIKYVERSHGNAKQRLAKEQDESQRRKVERYLKEQERLLGDAYSLLRDANIQVEGEL
ncbi:hypothetical protein ABL78_2814 [Leptomonas seymouri]|uniref:Uncharacterized protein n=1 Tax=Leptomonas seymouri TaxID=5684 RepID=A0A0N1ILP3_LEPSE|nr:hypothetical protein ABL78_2814 [Leptomonas seymouri]|eukprot:KPI88084.1 hypothetical protein ABL78_2814 [Leptomonas seymouri]